MPKTLNEPPFSSLPRIKQLSSYSCGPATLEMLLSFAGVYVNQTKIIHAVTATNKLKNQGMTIEELAIATTLVAPGLNFWFKRYSTMEELFSLVNEFHRPVGVEWQGVFEDDEEEEEGEDEDPGHYSVVTGLNKKENRVTLADPYKTYAGKDRHFTLLEFERRWWDINEVLDPRTQKTRQVDDYHALFIVLPKKEIFPEKMGMVKS